MKPEAQRSLWTPLSTEAFLHPGLSPASPLGLQPSASAMASNLPPPSLFPSIARQHQTPVFLLGLHSEAPRAQTKGTRFTELPQGPRADARSQAFFCHVPSDPLHRKNCGYTWSVPVPLLDVPGNQDSGAWVLHGTDPVTEKVCLFRYARSCTALRS